jgi:hypothetical protein
MVARGVKVTVWLVSCEIAVEPTLQVGTEDRLLVVTTV